MLSFETSRHGIIVTSHFWLFRKICAILLSSFLLFSLFSLLATLHVSAYMASPTKFYQRCRNGDCIQNCYIFAPLGVPDYQATPETPADYALLLVKCRVCGCLGSQHIYDPSNPSHNPQLSSDTPTPPPPIFKSATEDSLLNSRTSIPGSSTPNNSTLRGHGPFRQAAMDRDAKLREHVSGQGQQAAGKKQGFTPTEKVRLRILCTALHPSEPTSSFPHLLSSTQVKKRSAKVQKPLIMRPQNPPPPATPPVRPRTPKDRRPTLSACVNILSSSSTQNLYTPDISDTSISHTS
ncbi:hypothetical protein OH76DRAFT_310453 [Lentinus brumalis]|uniref:Uncharacterized protein n=1 Tax=Lentinus brumalis TaxID=2498619 RepID=A0A371CK88_9APHY|nr:hypothetical protein OH76DRAFT_310453 [Polyporus brumalis]